MYDYCQLLGQFAQFYFLEDITPILAYNEGDRACHVSYKNRKSTLIYSFNVISVFQYIIIIIIMIILSASTPTANESRVVTTLLAPIHIGVSPGLV
jgi:hypothetical protein